MKISKIEIKNFKSFDDVSINLSNFNAVVGECASGKSNFIEAFKFLKDIYEKFDNGITMHGGHLVQNFKHKSETPSCIHITICDDKPLSCIEYPVFEEDIGKIYFKSIDYELCFNFNKNDLKIINETVKFDFEIYEAEYLDSKLLLKNSLILKNQMGIVSSEFENNNFESEELDLEFFSPKHFLNITNNNFKEKLGLIINSPLSFVPFDWSKYFNEIHFYDFNPKFSKLGYANGNSILTEYGENLSLILENITKNKDEKRKFLNLVSDLLPYIEDIDVENIRDERRIFKLIESYDTTPVLAPFVSDGTANILALISALYFTNGDIIIIEEPERNIHPQLFIKLVSMMKEISSRGKQIIISTHSPEILDYCDLNDIYLISRNKNGFSRIIQPKDNDTVKGFVEDLGIGHVFLNNYLGFNEK